MKWKSGGLDSNKGLALCSQPHQSSGIVSVALEFLPIGDAHLLLDEVGQEIK